MRSNFSILIALEMKTKMPKDQVWGQRVYASHSNNQANLLTISHHHVSEMGANPSQKIGHYLAEVTDQFELPCHQI